MEILLLADGSKSNGIAPEVYITTCQSTVNIDRDYTKEITIRIININ